MSKHSPGPWHIHVNAGDDLEVNTTDGRTVVLWYQSRDCLSPGDPDLIAAAPEMRAILDEFMRGIQPQGDDGRVRVDGGFLLGVRERIAALLARIDGTTPPAL